MTRQHGFTLEHDEQVEDIATRARVYRHEKTGARVLSLENDDENKVFGIAFRTPADDSTGVAHILEHSVLSGSRKYPLKDPFAELAKSSLQTFLNAMTFPDKTVYPVASQNMRDFYNLVDVYLDTVFHPLLRDTTFDQEAWHYELEQPGASLIRKGVVYNEMKGAYSSPDDVLGERVRQSLFPTTPYRHEYGGDPHHIPDLTWEALKAFHAAYYHPSNAWIGFYGDDDPEQRLRLLAEYLDAFDARRVDSLVAAEPPFDAPRRIVAPYEAGEETGGGARGMVTVNWVFPETDDPATLFGLHVLGHALIGTPASPLRRALIDSGLGEDLAGTGMMMGEARQDSFSTGLRGVRAEDAERVEELALDTLRTLADAGLDGDTINASLNTIEFAFRENNTGSFPRGLEVLFRSVSTWLYERDPLLFLRFEAPLAAIRQRCATGDSPFEDLIRRHLLENRHRTLVVLEPDADFGKRRESEEKAELDAILAAMTRKERQRVIDNARRLKEIEETPDPPETLALIPRLRLQDLDRRNKTVPTESAERDGTRVVYHDLETRGIVYLDVGFNLHALWQEDLPYAGLLGRLFLEMGTAREDFVALSQRIGALTGGIHPLTFASPVSGQAQGATWLFLRAKATGAHAHDMLDILKDVLLTVQLDDRERLRQIVLEEKARLEAELVPAGHQVVARRLRAHFNEGAWAAEQLEGISYLLFIRKLADSVESNWDEALAALVRVRERLVTRSCMVCNVTARRPLWEAFEPKLVRFLDALPDGARDPVPWAFAGVAAKPLGMTLPAQVNYVGKALDLYRGGYVLHGSALVIARHLNMTWMWEKIRIQGGAYGGFCRFDHLSGIMAFLSYRDPNLLATLDVYHDTAGFLRSAPLDSDDVERSIIGTIGGIDRYELPDAQGFSSLARHLTGVTEEARQRLRDEVLATRTTDFRAFADSLEPLRDEGYTAVLGSASAIEQAAAEGPLDLQTIRVL